MGIEEEEKSSRNERQLTHSARVLLGREYPIDYLNQCTELLTKEKKVESLAPSLSVIIFRLSREWFAIPTQVVKAINKRKTIHTIPHLRSDKILGLVNIRGRLQFCMNIHALLQLEAREEEEEENSSESMVVIEREENLFVFLAEQIERIYHLPLGEIEKTPVTVSKSQTYFTKGLFSWNGRQVGLIDEELLFFSFARDLK